MGSAGAMVVKAATLNFGWVVDAEPVALLDPAAPGAPDPFVDDVVDDAPPDVA